MKIILTSKNVAKINATKKVIERHYKKYELLTLEVETGVSTTPFNDDEGILGALNRIEEAKRIDKTGDIYIGLEGILSENKYGLFICGWAVIETKDGKKSFGCSGKVQLPSSIANEISNFKELSDIIRSNYPSDLVNEISEIGSNGIITNKMYTRVDEFDDALMCAFGYLSNKTNF